jgi:putative pyruvate formate lyase activating enzyme
MFRQVGVERRLNSDGTMDRGLLIRLLVLPNGLADIEDSLRWIAESLSPEVQVALMAQYSPQHLAARPGRYPLLSRTISAGEWERAVDALETTMRGEHHFIQDHVAAPEYYLPDFSRPEDPFSGQ